jgi:hypothetical protein
MRRGSRTHPPPAPPIEGGESGEASSPWMGEDRGEGETYTPYEAMPLAPTDNVPSIFPDGGHIRVVRLNVRSTCLGMYHVDLQPRFVVVLPALIDVVGIIDDGMGVEVPTSGVGVWAL